MPKPNHGVGVRQKRSHSFGGCDTCRRRHVKCDQVHPKCLTCKAVGTECAGYRTDLKWISATNASVEGVDKPSRAPTFSSRRHLYSEKSRRAMTSVLQADLTSNSVDESISKLDELFRDSSTPIDRSHAVGPFGVLVFAGGIHQSESTSSRLGFNQDMGEGGISTDAPDNISPHTTQSLESFNNIDDFVDWPDLFDLDFSCPNLAPNDFNHAGPGTSLQSDMLDNFDQAAFAQTVFLIPHHDLSQLPPQITALPDPSIPAASLEVLPLSDAQTLLKHFNEQVIAHFSSMPPGEKSHWTVLNVRSATLTLAEITFMQMPRTSNAAMANLMALLAIAALHFAHQRGLEHSQGAPYWRNIGNSAFQKAKEHLKYSLRHEVRGTSHAKYKDQVMALSAMLAFAVLYDKHQEARAYMIDIERLVRIRGLSKTRVSRKARMLHHMYTWSRIVGESTYVLHNYNQNEINAAIDSYSKSSWKRRQVEESHIETNFRFGHNPKLDDFLRLDEDAVGSDIDVNAQKDTEKGLGDIHLEDPREFPATMYFQLYGISETWLSLLSQTTRLANILDSLEGSEKKKDVELMDSLERGKQRLEHMVCSFAATNKPMYASRSPQETVDQSLNGQDSQTENETPRSCMVRALNSALVIFFYRRIRNIHPWILREHVTSVLHALQDFEINCQTFKVEAVGCSWPVFLAGCEAITQPQRKYFLQWMDRAFAKTGFERFKTVKSCMQQVLEKRDSYNHQIGKSSRDQVWSWIHVSREQKIYMLLT